MSLRKFLLMILTAVLWCGYVFAQQQDLYPLDSLQKKDSFRLRNNDNYRFSIKKIIAPTLLISYGIVSLGNHAVDNLNNSTRYEISEHSPAKIKADNYTQYIPAVLVYTLNAAGIKGEHNFADRSIIFASSQLISASIVLSLKYSVKKERPDGSNNHSFPSGHTATAFSTAQFMYREYRHENFWLSISGYPFAVFTGVYRTLNNKHWVGDVAAGAGIGILSTEIAYWLYPSISQLLKGNKNFDNINIVPYYGSGSYGVGLVKHFRH